MLTFAELEHIVAGMLPRKPKSLRWHPAVFEALKATAAAAEWPPYAGPPLVSIEIRVDDEMPFGAWELLDGDDVVDQGTLRFDAALVETAQQPISFVV